MSTGPLSPFPDGNSSIRGWAWKNFSPRRDGYEENLAPIGFMGSGMGFYPPSPFSHGDLILAHLVKNPTTE
jgi:hypothetical protein